ncbi:hypothetical protein N7468_001116 [Penicillium chermesinum]|uniref:Major facilitator superfamily (MFS) profile domain-containing protein n=1 Tax=Penicillium chermesinum TaxID=63820 RepID=A0A9W9PI81_9EURO|nr:uncharacterized protein N7468_001116 [Penicillium chermesinum]KAJ5246133.1 hypothetical protein N7468_001116 [Penicillium chermesinum]
MGDKRALPEATPAPVPDPEDMQAQPIPKEVDIDSTPRQSQESTRGKELEVTPSKEPQREYLTGFRLVSVLAAVTLVSFLVLLDTSIVVTAIPVITTQFHSLPDLGWYGSSYQIASACLQPLAGRIYYNFSTKWTFLTFFFVFELGSLLCGIANSSKMLIVARAVAGMGSAGLMNGSLTIIGTAVPRHKSPKLMGIMMGCCQLGVVCGPLLGGAFTEYTTWRWCFYINLPIGCLVAAMITFVHIPDQAEKPSISMVIDTVLHKLDLIGFALFAPAAIQLLLALEYGQTAGTFGVFLLWEWRQGDLAMIPLRMVAKRTVWSSCLVMMCLFAVMLGSSYYLPVYFQAVKNDSPLISGVSLLPSILSQLSLAVISGNLISRLGYYLPWALFGACLSAIGNGLFSTFTPHTAIGTWIGYQILAGAGRGAAFQVPLVAVQNTVAPRDISLGMSLLMFLQTLSGAIFLTLGDVIFDAGLKSTIPKDAPNVDPAVVIGAGATGIRSVVSGKDLAGVLVAYSKSVGYVFYMTAAMSVVMALCSLGMGWVDIRPKPKPAPEQAEV